MKKGLNSKPILIGMVLIILIALSVVLYNSLLKDTDMSITYEDYTILKGHTGRIEKYDPSYAVEGYKGDGKTAYYIYGKLTSDKNKKFTVVTFNLYDNSNHLLGTAVAGLNEVEKGKTYDFKAVSLIEGKDVPKIDHYKIKEIKNMEVK